MKRITIAIATLALVAAACGGAGGAPAGSSSAPTVAPATSTTIAGAPPVHELLALALHRLATVDTTFGQGHRFSELLVQTHLDPAAGSATGGDTARALTDLERSAIETALAEVGPMRWIDNASEWRTTDLMPVVEGSAILGVGEPVFDGDGALVPVSLWCGGLCGTWFTYRLIGEGGGWVVVGPEGPVAVS